MRFARSVSRAAIASVLSRLFMTVAIWALALVGVDSARAEEGGAGHYAPGGAASFIDALPGRPGWAMGNFFMYYNGSAAGQFPIAGLISFDLKTRAYADNVLGLYQTPLKVFGGDYVVGLAIPFVRLEVDGSVTGPGGKTIQRSETANGVGDILLYPFMVSWLKGDLKGDARFGVYAPTGKFEKGRLANIGKNYWTFEPVVSVSWLSSKVGTEVSAYAGLDFSTKNNTTDYQSGDVFHFDATAAQHLPLGKSGIIGVGANVFYYQQISGDSGAGTRVLGSFKGRTTGIGPAVSFITKIGKTNLAAEVKWLPELDVENRVKGDFVWFKLGLSF